MCLAVAAADISAARAALGALAVTVFDEATP